MKKYLKYIIGTTVVAAASFWFINVETLAGISWIMLLLGLILVVFLTYTGKVAKRRFKSTLPERWMLVGHHQAFAACVTTCVLVGVVGIEILVTRMGGMWGNPWLIALHLTFAVAMLVALVFVLLKYTGIANPSMHRMLVYPFMMFYAVAFYTGTGLLSEKFSFFETMVATSWSVIAQR